MAMTKRENCFAVMNHDNPEWILYNISYTPDLHRRVQEQLKVADSIHQHGFPGGGISAPYEQKEFKPDFSKYFADMKLPEGFYIDGWGIGHIPSSKYHFDKYIFPMRNFKNPKEVEEYPLPPDPPYEDETYLQALKKSADEIKASDLIAVSHVGSIFESAWYLRGMDNLLADFVLNEDLAAALLDTLTERSIKQARAAGIAGVEFLGTGDDVGMQHRMIMSPDEWRKWLKPRFAKVLAAAKEHKPDMHIKYHSDGFIEPIIPDLIEIGVTILNPVQPECMDPVKLKEQYGDRLSFDGTIGIQTTMPFGTTDDVKREVKHMIETVGKGGGLIIAPTHVLEPEVPVENIKAFLEAVDEYGHYV
jgi:uroporphyrinogen decarboxylase